ncbi:helicase [Homarus gammarus nudivirus]|uniref:Helicase n=1 Tax=Homarus gammarus nudivirus TaxID=2509616 RepID=A0A411HBC3_9VIRU|nr:helicase [Homarus gammarus nudivirus]QBB28689.1 helicase [Homarus gammarus nudivirus]
MAKRNWDDISDSLVAAIENAATITAAATTTQQPPKKKSCYDIDKDNVVHRNTNKYLYDKFYNKREQTNQQIYYLQNNLTATAIRVPKDNDITIEELQQYFDQSGHSLAYKISDSYVTKLMFDFDCYKCKHNSCNSLVEYEVIKIIHDDVCEFLKELFRCDSIGCVIFKKANSCNLHFYFNVSVSLPLFELIKKRITSHLDTTITEKYLVDDIYALDLPYSTKNGYDVYKPIYNTPNVDFAKFLCLPSSNNFYDVELKLSVDESYTDRITLGTFRTTYSSVWNENVEHIKYLTTPLEVKPVLMKNENILISNIKFSKVNFHTEYITLDKYFKTDSEEDYTILKDAPDFVDTLDVEDLKILRIISQLGNMIISKVQNNTTTNGLANLLKFIAMASCNYAFYTICCVIFYTYNMNQTKSLLSVKLSVLKILLLAVKSSNHHKNDALIHIINTLNTYDCMSNLTHVFENTDEWFLYLIYVAKLELQKDLPISLDDKRVNIVTLKLKTYENINCITEELVELCKMLMPLIKVEYSLSKSYYYVDDGIYLPISSEKFLSHTNVKIQMVENILKNTLDKLRDSNQITDDLCKSVNIKAVWLLYFKSLNIVNPTFNFYDYFISTDLGVFNTLTGLYMSHTPLLHMGTKKAYCRIPTSIQNINLLPMSELNKHIIKDNQGQLYANVLDILLNEQNFIFYGSVLIPGLLCLEDTLYSEQQEDSMMNLVFETIIHDDNDVNKKLLYLTDTLIVKHNLCIENLLFVEMKLKQNLSELGTYSRSDFSRYCKMNDIKFSRTHSFRKLPNVQLYDQLCQQNKQFKPKFFALSVVMAAFELAHSMNAKLPMFQWVDEDSNNIKISPNHIFHNVNNLSFSIKNHDKIKTVLAYLISNDNIPEALCNLVNTLSVMLCFDPIMIKDFLNNFAMIYHHNSKRKKMVLLIGSPNSGKSTYQHMMFDIHGKSKYSVNSIIQSDKEGPSPEVINALTNYLFSIIEIKSMTATTMKGMISHDVTHKRLCHQNEMIELKPLSFTVAAANALPNVFRSDEAVRDRLAPFMFKTVFVNEHEIDNLIDDNVLLATISNYLVSNTKFQIPTIAREFSNLLYEQYQNIRDNNGLIVPTIDGNNKTSQKLIEQTLVNNNTIYYILHASGVVFDKSLSITYETLKEVTLEEIEKHNENTKYKKFTWDYFKNELSILFKHKEMANGLCIRGMGKRCDKLEDPVEVVVSGLLVPQNGQRTTLTQIRSHLYHNQALSLEVINDIISKLKIKYSVNYNITKKSFIDYKINNG